MLAATPCHQPQTPPPLADCVHPCERLCVYTSLSVSLSLCLSLYNPDDHAHPCAPASNQSSCMYRSSCRPCSSNHHAGLVPPGPPAPHITSSSAPCASSLRCLPPASFLPARGVLVLLSCVHSRASDAGEVCPQGPPACTPQRSLSSAQTPARARKYRRRRTCA